MLFEKIKHQMTAAEFRAAFPDTKAGVVVTFGEKIAGREIVYQLKFNDDVLSSVKVSLNGDFVESEYIDMTAIGLSLIEAQAERGITAQAIESALMPWKDLIQSPLPESGKPDERYIAALNVSWPVLGWNVTLTFRWTWPGQLTLEYSEVRS